MGWELEGSPAEDHLEGEGLRALRESPRDLGHLVPKGSRSPPEPRGLGATALWLGRWRAKWRSRLSFPDRAGRAQAREGVDASPHPSDTEGHLAEMIQERMAKDPERATSLPVSKRR